MASGGGGGRTDECLEIQPCVLQNISPKKGHLGILAETVSTDSSKTSKKSCRRAWSRRRDAWRPRWMMMVEMLVYECDGYPKFLR